MSDEGNVWFQILSLRGELGRQRGIIERLVGRGFHKEAHKFSESEQVVSTIRQADGLFGELGSMVVSYPWEFTLAEIDRHVRIIDAAISSDFEAE